VDTTAFCHSDNEQPNFRDYVLWLRKSGALARKRDLGAGTAKTSSRVSTYTSESIKPQLA
jgi:hypothetical protein